MSVLVVGLSHRTAPVSLLEKAVVPVDDLRKTVEELQQSETIGEVLLLSTCNRVEVYADVVRFHPAVAHEALRWALDAKARAEVVPVAGGPGRSMAVTRPGPPPARTTAPVRSPSDDPAQDALDRAG